MPPVAVVPPGVYTTLITPFLPDASGIDNDALDRLVEWQVSNGVAGIFSPCQSSEMVQLCQQEREQLAARVQVRGRTP